MKVQEAVNIYLRAACIRAFQLCKWTLTLRPSLLPLIFVTFLFGYLRLDHLNFHAVLFCMAALHGRWLQWQCRLLQLKVPRGEAINGRSLRMSLLYANTEMKNMEKTLWIEFHHRQLLRSRIWTMVATETIDYANLLRGMCFFYEDHCNSSVEYYLPIYC